MGVQLKLRTGFLLVVIVMSIASGVILWNQSKMRDAFEVSNASVQLEDYLLECRRQEKNFLLRGKNEYVEYFNISYDSLYTMTTHLIAKTDNKSMKAELTNLGERESAYKASYDSLIQRSQHQEVSQVNREALVTQMVEEARDCHSLIANIRSLALTNFNTAKSSSHIINIAALVVGILLSVLIAGIISDQVIQQMEEGPK